jgi:hypothetical protein
VRPQQATERLRFHLVTDDRQRYSVHTRPTA